MNPVLNLAPRAFHLTAWCLHLIGYQLSRNPLSNAAVLSTRFTSTNLFHRTFLSTASYADLISGKVYQTGLFFLYRALITVSIVNIWSYMLQSLTNLPWDTSRGVISACIFPNSKISKNFLITFTSAVDLCCAISILFSLCSNMKCSAAPFRYCEIIPAVFTVPESTYSSRASNLPTTLCISAVTHPILALFHRAVS